MKFSPEIRRAIYTANAFESLNFTVQWNLKTRLSFPSDEAAMKLIFMILHRGSKKWTMPISNWLGHTPSCRHLRGQSPVMNFALYTKNVTGSKLPNYAYCRRPQGPA